MASSQGIPPWTPLKPQQSNPNPNPNPLDYQLWYINFLTPPTPLFIPTRLPAFLESLMPRKNWCSIHARWSKSSLKHSIHFYGSFPSLKHNFLAYRSSKVSSRPDCIFEIHQPWQSDFSWVYSNCYCSCWFEPEIIKIGQSFHKIYSNNIVNFQVSTTILNVCTKKVWTLIATTCADKRFKYLFCGKLANRKCHQHKPRKRYKDCLEENLKSLEIDIKECESKTFDRNNLSWIIELYQERKERWYAGLNLAFRKGEKPLNLPGGSVNRQGSFCHCCQLSKARHVKHLKSDTFKTFIATSSSWCYIVICSNITTQ